MVLSFILKYVFLNGILTGCKIMSIAAYDTLTCAGSTEIARLDKKQCVLIKQYKYFGSTRVVTLTLRTITY